MGCDGDTHAGTHKDVSILDFDYVADRTNQAIGNGLKRFLRRWRRDQDHELVTTQARHHVHRTATAGVLAQDAAQTASHFHQS